MKFHRIKLRDYRGIRFCEIEPRESGVTVIEGENEVGKSSIAEALWLIFDLHDDSSSKLAESLRPLGRDAATEVEVEVSTGPYRFVYFKRFHRGARTELTIVAPRRETLSGREADNRAKAILEETIDTSLWKALRSQQGMEDSLEPPVAGKHQSLMGALETAAGPLMGGEREQAVFEAAQQEYERYFTSTGRERASGDGPSLPRLRAVAAEAATELDRLEKKMAELEVMAARASGLEDALKSAAQELARATELREALDGKDRARQAISAKVERLRAELQAREAEGRSLTTAAEHREQTQQGIAARKDALDAEEVAAADGAPELEALAEALSRTGAALEAARNAYSSALKAEARSEELVQLSTRQLQVEQMAERLARLESLEPEIAQLDAWLAGCRVDAAVVARLDALDKEAAVLNAHHEAERAYVSISAEEDTSIDVDGKPVSLAAGQPRKGSVRETVMRFPGGITVAITAGSAARETAAKAREADAAFADALEKAGVLSLDEAKEILGERTRNEERRAQFAAQVKNDLRDLPTARELADKLQRERTAIAGILRDFGLAEIPTVDVAKLRRDEAATTVATLEAELRKAEAAEQTAREAHGVAERGAQLRAERIESMRGELQRAEAELARLREQQSDEELAGAVASASNARTAAEQNLADALAELGECEDVTEQLRAATAEVARLSRLEGDLGREEAGIRALLEAAGADGLHGQLADAQERADAATGELESTERRANAARLLFQTLRERRDEARVNYAGPLKDRIEALGRRVYNPSFGVELSDDLRITRRTLDGVSLDLANLSVGAREQLSVLMRLACAALVSADGGAPLVLDDVLGWADQKRLEALGPVLAGAAGESQVLLFTCSPARFASVSPALVISLPSGARSERPDPGAASVPERRASETVRAAAAASLATRPPQGAFDLFDTPPAPRVP